MGANVHSVEFGDRPVIVIGGGIGGMAATLALNQHGPRVTLLQQAAEIGARDGRIYHAKGIECHVRNSLWKGRTLERF